MPVLYTSEQDLIRKGIHGVQRAVVRVFLMGVENDYGRECPRGRGGRDESPLRIIPSQFSKTIL